MTRERGLRTRCSFSSTTDALLLPWNDALIDYVTPTRPPRHGGCCAFLALAERGVRGARGVTRE